MADIYDFHPDDVWVCGCPDHAYLHGRIRKAFTLVAPGGPKGCGCYLLLKSRSNLMLALVDGQGGKKFVRWVNPVTYRKVHGKDPQPYQKQAPAAKPPRQKKPQAPKQPRQKAPPKQQPTGGKNPQQKPQTAGKGGQKGPPAPKPTPKPSAVPQKINTLRESAIAWADPKLVDASMQKHMYDHQLKGAAHCIRAMDDSGGAILGDGTGVGKSTQLLGIAQTYANRGKKVLIIAPSGVIKPKWGSGKIVSSLASDAERMGVAIKLNDGKQAMKSGDIHVSTYSKLEDVSGLVDKDTIVLFDEAHNLKTDKDMSRYKNAGDLAKLPKSMSKTSKLGALVSLKAGSVLYSSATLAGNSPLELSYLAHRVDVFDGMTRNEFMNKMGIKRVKGSRKIDTTSLEVAKNLESHFEKLTRKGLFLAREVTLENVDVQAKKITLGRGAQRVMQDIDSHYGKQKRGISLMQQRMFAEQFKVPAIVDEVKQAIADGYAPIVFIATPNDSTIKDEDGKVVIERQGTAKLLMDALAKEGITELAHLHGGGAKAKKGMQRFQSGEAQVAIATPQSGGTGIDLDRKTTGDKPRRIIMATTPFSATDTVQIFGRINRLMTAQDGKRTEIRFLYSDSPIDAWNAEIALNKVRNVGATTGGRLRNLAKPDIEDLTSTPEKILKAFDLLRANAGWKGRASWRPA